MPPKRRSTRPSQLQPQPAPLPAQSDYDTDTLAVTDSLPSLAPPPQRSNTELNLTVLRKYCPAITSIVSIAPFAVVYTFSTETQQWEKHGVEGTLFVCHLTSTTGLPRYNVMMLNRKSLDNFIVELVSADDVDITDQYVILQAAGEDGSPQIYGLWIFSDGETEPSTREVVAQTIQSCAMQVQIARDSANETDGANGGPYDGVYEVEDTADEEEQIHEEQKPVTQQVGHQVDLLSLFGSHPMQSAPPPASVQTTRFPSTADTDFFRSTHSPAAAAQQQQQARPPQAASQQNALLNLFKG